MTRTLLVDTNRAAVPIYRALRDLGHEVWVVGGKPAETLAKLAANYVQLDYSDAPRLAAFVKEKAFDYVVPGCTDLSYRVCAEINHSRFPGIDTPENERAINSKSEFRKVAAELGLPVPRVLSLEQAAAVESVIVKPVDSFSGRGMTVLRAAAPDKLNKAFEVACKASKTGNAIIEEFIAGQLFSHSAFVWDGKVAADFVVQEDCVTNPFTVDTSRVAPDFPGEILDSLRASILRLASSLKLTNGLIHTQFIVREDKYRIVEMTRRCPGDLYSLLIEFSTGYPYAASYAAPFVGKEPASLVIPQSRKEEGRPSLRCDRHGGPAATRAASGDQGVPSLTAAGLRERITRHTVTSRDGASLWGFRFACPVDIRLFVPLATSGDFIGPSPYGRAGIFFFRSTAGREQDILYKMLLDGKLYSFS